MFVPLETLGYFIISLPQQHIFLGWAVVISIPPKQHSAFHRLGEAKHTAFGPEFYLRGHIK